jgi:hypothetical protein
MSDSIIVLSLRKKRDELSATIRSYEHELEQARANFAHITAALAVFDAGDKPGSQRPYSHMFRGFRYGEIALWCREKLTEGPLSTPDLTKHVMEKKGMDTSNRVLVRSMGFSVLQSLRGMSRRQMVQKLPKSRGRCVWRLTSEGAAANSLSIGAKRGVALLTSQSQETASR